MKFVMNRIRWFLLPDFAMTMVMITITYTKVFYDVGKEKAFSFRLAQECPHIDRVK